MLRISLSEIIIYKVIAIADEERSSATYKILDSIADEIIFREKEAHRLNKMKRSKEILLSKINGSTPKCVLDSIKLSRHVYYILKKFLLHNTLYSL